MKLIDFYKRHIVVIISVILLLIVTLFYCIFTFNAGISKCGKTFIKMNELALKIENYYLKGKKLPNNLHVLEVHSTMLIDAWGNFISYKIINEKAFILSTIDQDNNEYIEKRFDFE